MKFRITSPFVLVLLAAAVAGCGDLGDWDLEPPKMNFTGPEALAWLKQNKNESALASNRFLETENAIRFVTQLYDAGAEKVIIPEDTIEDEPDGPYADALVVTLPTDPVKRKQVIAICKKEVTVPPYS
jgi:hypothetical protein